MPALEPPIHLANPSNEPHLRYFQEVVAKHGFDDYSQVSFTLRIIFQEAT